MKMTLLRNVTLGVGTVFAGMLLPGPLPAQDPSTGSGQAYPTRPVRMVVPFPAGAASDFLARVLGQKLTDAWRQQIVVDNRPGAGGLCGGPALRDFSHIGQVPSIPNVLTVSPGLQVNSLSELIAQVKAKPGYYNVGSAGMGSSSHLAAEMFNAAAGLKSVHVPFKLLGD